MTQFDAMRAAIAEDDEALRTALAALIEAQTGQPASDLLLTQALAQIEAFAMLGYVDYDVTNYWSQVDVPVLALYGGLDTQVAAAQNIPVLEATLADETELSIVTINEANHLFQQAVTGSPNEYASLEQTMMPALLDELTTWLLDHVDIVD
ncbi:MAG: hypothetical protein Q9P44_08595 [Anaerolineae bacterium]|nr:hypothetical protein [Anaerolineae bacterium]